MGIFSGGTIAGGEINAGAGKIDLFGRCDAPVATTLCRGVQLNAWGAGNEDNFKIVSNNPATDSIKIRAENRLSGQVGFANYDGLKVENNNGGGLLVQADSFEWGTNNYAELWMKIDGPLVFESVASTWPSTFEWSADHIENVTTSTPSSVRVGRTTNVSSLIFNKPTSASNNIEVYGSNWQLDGSVNVLNSTGSGQVLLKAETGNLTINSNVTANSRPIVLWANQYFRHNAGATVDSTGGRSSSTTSGAPVIIGGGATTTRLS